MVEQKLLPVLNASSVITKQEAGETYIATIRQLMRRFGRAPDITRRGNLIILVVRSIQCVLRW